MSKATISRFPRLYSLQLCSLPVLTQIRKVRMWSHFQFWVCRAHGVDSIQASRDQQVSVTCPVVAANALGEWDFPAASSPASMAL
eukprot:1027105-Amphidinium_carterae.1